MKKLILVLSLKLAEISSVILFLMWAFVFGWWLDPGRCLHPFPPTDACGIFMLTVAGCIATVVVILTVVAVVRVLSYWIKLNSDWANRIMKKGG